MAAGRRTDTGSVVVGSEPGSGARGGSFRAEGITVRFGGLTALDSVSLTVEPGQVHGVIGPNGAGKTTLFNVVCGFLRPDEGSLSWRGAPLEKLRPHQLAGLGISRTLQGVGLFAGLTVLENVMAGRPRQAKAGFLPALLGPAAQRQGRARLRERAMATLHSLGAAQYAGRYPGSLPYPVQKRVALAARPGQRARAAHARRAGRRPRRRRDGRARRHHPRPVRAAWPSCSSSTTWTSSCASATASRCSTSARSSPNGTPDEVREDPLVLAAYLGDEGESAEALGGTEGGGS
jgi:branched-chain amino acid transport system ATP-binding protein